MYRDDLAYIHHQGFSEFAESAAPFVISQLHKHGAKTVIELGCGSGILARELTDGGFDVHGYDASPSMIAIARETAPLARFDVAAFADVHAHADAVLAMGEVLNYGTFDEVRTFVANANTKLLLFDVAESGAYPPYDEVRTGGDDWSVIAIKESDGVHLTRRVLTFREDGRRDEEVHHLQLYDRGELTALLRAHGFRVTIRRSYGARRLPAGHGLYIALSGGILCPIPADPPGRR
ncbi:MAG TPA: class I SAM-dependent methyltransferase [Thermoanaerobaculia bacterium]|nr:class I SAM-dependent methyltransferase [Thermoanaerobaculia bacterium]